MFHFELGRNGLAVAETKCVKKLDSTEMPMKNSPKFLKPKYDKLFFRGTSNFMFNVSETKI